MSNNTVDIYFSIRSDSITPDFLTDYLGLIPSSFCVKGAVKREGQTPYMQNVWTIKVSNLLQLNMLEQMQKLLEILSPVKFKLKDISEQCLLDVECVVHICSDTATTPMIDFEKNVVQFFAEIGASLGMDIYCDC
jgi:hypothetical protein